MAKYFITGGLAGPWKKEKIKNSGGSTESDIIRVPFSISYDDVEHTYSVTTTSNFNDIVAAKLSGKTIIAEAVHSSEAGVNAYSALMNIGYTSAMGGIATLYATFIGNINIADTKVTFKQLTWTNSGPTLKDTQVDISI